MTKRSSEEEELSVLALLVALKDHRAFARLAYKINPQLKCWLRKWIRNKHDLEDIMQEILLKMVTSLEAGKYHGGSFYAWLYSLVRSEAIDFIRKCRIKFVYEEPWHNMADAGTEPALALEEICKKAEAIVEKLPEKRRAVFKLRVLSEKTFAEIGREQGGRSASDMSSAFIKARNTVRESLLGRAKALALMHGEKNFRNEDAKPRMHTSI
jgi:RNA polymerase sigma factor (sigma-70 family)